MNILMCYISTYLLTITRIKRLLPFVVLLFFSGNTYAGACPTIINVTGPALLNVNSSTPDGTVVGRMTLSWPNTNGTCMVNHSGNVNYEFQGYGVPNGNLYPTSIPGISYRGSFPGWSIYGLGGYWPTSAIQGISAGNYVNAGSILIEFIKIGPISAGTFGPATLEQGYEAGNPWYNIYMTNQVSILPAAPSCTVTQSAIPVQLDDVTTGQFTRVGQTLADKAFNIPLVCSTPANISLSFSGSMADNTNGVFQNTNGATAANIGIQLLDKNNNPISTTAGSRVAVGAVSGPLNYPMTARYYALTSNVPAGDVSAIAYATIIYN